MGGRLVHWLRATLPAFTLGAFLELNWATKATIQLLLLLSAVTALMFGYIVRMLEPLDSAEDRSGACPGGPTPESADPQLGS